MDKFRSINLHIEAATHLSLETH